MTTTLLIISTVIFLAAVVYRHRCQARNAEQERILDSRNEYLEKKLVDVSQDVEYQQEALCRHQEKIRQIRDEQLAGIRRAKRIQTAVFTQQMELHNVFPEAFIFTKTHSIVSGDLYKVAEMEHYKVFVLADCSGYGVPGGFLSMLGIALINEQLSMHHQDTDINLTAMLDSMRDNVIQALDSDGNTNVNDGMNMTICAFSKHDGKVYFAGAGQNLYICHEGKVRVINGDKQPIGSHIKGKLPFTQHEEQVCPGDMVYLTTDSLQSQFGGPQGAKFTHKRVISMFEEISAHTADEQKSIIHKIVYDWVEGHKQIDDLTLAGVRI